MTMAARGKTGRDARTMLREAADTTTADSPGRPLLQHAVPPSSCRAVVLSCCRAAEPSTRGTRIYQTFQQQQSSSRKTVKPWNRTVKPSKCRRSDARRCSSPARHRAIAPTPRPHPGRRSVRPRIPRCHSVIAQTSRIEEHGWIGACVRALEPPPGLRGGRCGLPLENGSDDARPSTCACVRDTSVIGIKLAERTSNNKGRSLAHLELDPLALVDIRPHSRFQPD